MAHYALLDENNIVVEVFVEVEGVWVELVVTDVVAFSVLVELAVVLVVVVVDVVVVEVFVYALQEVRVKVGSKYNRTCPSNRSVSV